MTADPPQPRTEAGRNLVATFAADPAHEFPESDLGQAVEAQLRVIRIAILAIEAEAALLARPQTPDALPDNALYSSAVTHGYHARSGDHECREYVVGVCALPALARRAPGDRDLREALALHYVTAIDCDHDARTDTIRCNCSVWTGTPQPSVGAAVREWVDHVLRALRADSRPEQPAPRDSEQPAKARRREVPSVAYDEGDEGDL